MPETTNVENILPGGDDESEAITFHCHGCNENFNEEDESPTEVNGDVYCDSCYSDTFTTCHDCGETTHQDDTRSVGHNTICDSCFDSNYSECAHCCENVHDSDTVYRADGDRICDSCYSDHYFTCDNCSEVLNSSEYCGDGMCGECHQEEEEDDDGNTVAGFGDHDEFDATGMPITRHSTGGIGTVIKGYSDKTASNKLGLHGKMTGGILPIPDLVSEYPSHQELDEFSCQCGECPPIYKTIYDRSKPMNTSIKTPKRDGYLYGLELETECLKGFDPHDLAMEVYKRMGQDFIAIKSDSSLSNGFEIVTAPADIATHAKRFGSLLSTRIDGLASWSKSSTGLHIHVSRSGIGQFTLGKLLVFVNDPDNREMVYRIAGRRDSGFAKLERKRLIDGKRGGYRERYEAINLNNEKTIEFRLFKGSLKFSRIMMNIEFCAAAIAFARDHSPLQLKGDTFKAWVSSTPKAYPFLVAWMRENGMIAKPKAKPVVLVA